MSIRFRFVAASVVLLAGAWDTFAADFDLLKSSVVESARSLQRLAAEEQTRLERSGVQVWNTAPTFLEASRKGDAAAVIAALNPLIEANPDSLAVLGAYEHIVRAYRTNHNPEQADQLARKGIEAIEDFVSSSDRAEMLWVLQIHRGLNALLTKYSDADYEKEKQFCARLLSASQYGQWKDMIWLDLCEIEFARGNYAETLANCTLIDEFYSGLPDTERGRLLHDQWRARAMFKLGQKSEAVIVMETLAKDRYALVRDELILREAREMQAELETTAPVPATSDSSASARALAPNESCCSGMVEGNVVDKAASCCGGPIASPSATPRKSGDSCCGEKTSKGATDKASCCGGNGGGGCGGSCVTAKQPTKSEHLLEQSDKGPNAQPPIENPIEPR